MIKKWGIRLLIALLIIAAIIFYTTPAKLIQNQLNDNIEQLTIAKATGHLSSGEFHRINVKGQFINQLSWDLDLLKLFIGKLAGTLEVIDPKVDGSLYFSQQFNGQMNLSEINLVQSVTALADIQPGFKLIQPDGEITWQDVALSLDEKQFYSASGNIIWSNASLEVNQQLLDLGEIILSPMVDGKDLVLMLTSDSILDVIGNVRVKMDHTYALEFSLQSQLPPTIKQSVQYITPLGDDGRYHFKMSGVL